MPVFSKHVSTYWDPTSFLLTLGFCTAVDVLSFLPVGKVVNGRRMNGIVSLVLMMAAVPALIHFKVTFFPV